MTRYLDADHARFSDIFRSQKVPKVPKLAEGRKGGNVPQVHA